VPVNPDFRDLFAALNAAGARYLLVGGYAVAFHAQPRFTKDLDVWTDPDPAPDVSRRGLPRGPWAFVGAFGSSGGLS